MFSKIASLSLGGVATWPAGWIYFREMLSFPFLLVLVLVTASSSQLYEDDRFSRNCLSEESPALKQIFVRPCTNETQNVKKFNTDILIINNTFIECDNNRSRNAVSVCSKEYVVTSP